MSPDVERPIATSIEELTEKGPLLDAIDELTLLNARHPDAQLEEQIAQLRARAFDEVRDQPARGHWPPDFPDPFPESEGMPEISVGDLSTEVVGGAIRHHGCILVRGLLSQHVSAHLVDCIERAFAGQEAWRRGAPASETTPWFAPLDPDLPRPAGPIADPQGPQPPADPLLPEERVNPRWYRVHVMDSPRSMFEVVRAFEAAGLADVVRGLLGPHPMVADKKWTLRRMPRRDISGWHQERSVFDVMVNPDVAGPPSAASTDSLRALNVWIALSRCGPGTDAPSIEFMPRTPHDVIPTIPGSFMIAPADADAVVAPDDIATPVYEPGDGVLFDDWTLHRTYTRQEMTGFRYSLESWFFEPAAHPPGWGPVVF